MSPRRPSSPEERAKKPEERYVGEAGVRSAPGRGGHRLVTTTATWRRSRPLNMPKLLSHWRLASGRPVRVSGSLRGRARSRNPPDPTGRHRGCTRRSAARHCASRFGHRQTTAGSAVVVEVSEGRDAAQMSSGPAMSRGRGHARIVEWPSVEASGVHGSWQNHRAPAPRLRAIVASSAMRRGEARQVRLHYPFPRSCVPRFRTGGRAVSAIGPRSLALRPRLATGLPWTSSRARDDRRPVPRNARGQSTQDHRPEVLRGRSPSGEVPSAPGPPTSADASGSPRRIATTIAIATPTPMSTSPMLKTFANGSQRRQGEDVGQRRERRRRRRWRCSSTSSAASRPSCGRGAGTGRHVAAVGDDRREVRRARPTATSGMPVIRDVPEHGHEDRARSRPRRSVARGRRRGR